jgi:hypothetical protein
VLAVQQGEDMLHTVTADDGPVTVRFTSSGNILQAFAFEGLGEARLYGVKIASGTAISFR